LVVTVQVAASGVGSTLSDGSVARTSKVWVPSARKEYVIGDAQATKVARLRRHSKVEPASFELNVKVADVLDVKGGGADVIVVSGAAEIVHAAWAGFECFLEPVLIARTSNVCDPSESPE